MKAKPLSLIMLSTCVIGLSAGCALTSTSNLNEAETRNRILSQQNLAQQAEIENLKTHGRTLEDRLIKSEEEIATLKKQNDLNQRQLTNFEREHGEMFEQFKALARNRAGQTLESSSKTSSQSGSPDSGNMR